MSMLPGFPPAWLCVECCQTPYCCAWHLPHVSAPTKGDLAAISVVAAFLRDGNKTIATTVAAASMVRPAYGSVFFICGCHATRLGLRNYKVRGYARLVR